MSIRSLLPHPILPPNGAAALRGPAAGRSHELAPTHARPDSLTTFGEGQEDSRKETPFPRPSGPREGRLALTGTMLRRARREARMYSGSRNLGAHAAATPGTRAERVGAVGRRTARSFREYPYLLQRTAGNPRFRPSPTLTYSGVQNLPYNPAGPLRSRGRLPRLQTKRQVRGPPRGPYRPLDGLRGAGRRPSRTLPADYAV